MNIPQLEDPAWSRNYGDEAVGAAGLDAPPRDEEEDPSEAVAEPPAPLLRWAPAFRARLEAGERFPLLLVAVHECAAVAARAAAGDAALRVVGTLLLPELPLAAAGHPDGPLGAVADGAASCVVCELEGRGALLVLAQQHVPAARAFAWADALLREARADRTVVLDSMVAGTYQPAEHGADRAPLLRLVGTLPPPPDAAAALERLEARAGGAPAASEAARRPVCPPLEQPNLARGLAAALLAQCQADGRAGELYLSLLCPHEEVECVDAFGPALAAAGLLGEASPLGGLPPKGRRAAYAEMLERLGKGLASRARVPDSAAGHDGLADAGRATVPANLFM